MHWDISCLGHKSTNGGSHRTQLYSIMASMIYHLSQFLDFNKPVHNTFIHAPSTILTSFQTSIDETHGQWRSSANYKPQTFHETHQQACTQPMFEPIHDIHHPHGVNLLAWYYAKIFPCEVSPHNSWSLHATVEGLAFQGEATFGQFWPLHTK